jgi:hypothetical protein
MLFSGISRLMISLAARRATISYLGRECVHEFSEFIRAQRSMRSHISYFSSGKRLRDKITHRLSRPGMLAVSSAPRPARMPILRLWLHLRDENRPKKILLILGIEGHWEDRRPVASG